MIPSGSRWLKPEKKEIVREEEWVPLTTWRASSLFVEEDAENDVISEYEWDEDFTSCSSGSKARRYRERGSPKSSKKDGESAMEMTPSPVRRMFSAPSDSEGYHTCYPSDGAGAEPDSLVERSHTAPNPELAHDAEREALQRRSATTRVPRHTDFRMMGAEAGRMELATLSWGEERSGELQEVRRVMAGTEKEMVDIHTRTPRKWRAGTECVKITAIPGMWTSSSGDIPR